MIPGPISPTDPASWLVTGAAGFIGSHLVEHLLRAGQHVTGLDNFSTGSRENLADAAARAGDGAWRRFQLVEGDIRSAADCQAATSSVDYVLHQAALNSVPRSLKHPAQVTEVNVYGSVRLLESAIASGARRIICASSSSVYGDTSEAVRREDRLGRPLSPYAASKRAVEEFSTVLSAASRVPIMNLRYFNVFGSRQNPDGPYAAVIPRWTRCLLRGEQPVLYGDGTQSRDFTDVRNVVQANLLAATAADARGGCFNVASGRPLTLSELFGLLRQETARAAGDPSVLRIEPRRAPPRPGDVHSAEADLERARSCLGYEPGVTFAQGLPDTVGWFARDAR